MNNPTLHFGESDQSSLFELPAAPPDLGKFTKSESTDFAATLNDMVKSQKDTAEKDGTNIVLDPLNFSNYSGDLELIKKLKDINELIRKGQHNQAIKALDAILKQDPNHHEAIYLLAYCQFMSNQPEVALRTLRYLDDVRLTGDLFDKVQSLQELIRNRTRIMIMMENLMMLMVGQFDKAIERLQHHISLDPTNPLLYFLASGTMLKGERYKLALDTVEAGIERCSRKSQKAVDMHLALRPDDSQQNPDLANLLHFRNLVQDHYVIHLMQPARRAYKNRNYGKAYNQLRSSVPDRYRGSELYRLFENYLQELKPSGFLLFKKSLTPTVVKMPGTSQQLEKLCSFLVNSEINEAQQLMHKGRIREAERVMNEAVIMTPNYPYVNYVYAGILFGEMFKGMMTRTSSPSNVIGKLEAAERHATIGAQDKEIQDAAMLKQMISLMLKQAREAAIVMPLRDAHHKLIQQINKGAMDAVNIPRYKSELDRIKRDVSTAKRNANKQAGTMMDKLAIQIDNDLTSLELAECFMLFDTAMKALERKAPLRSRSDVEEFRSKFRIVQTKTADLLRRMPANIPGSNELQQLKNTIDEVLKRLS